MSATPSSIYPAAGEVLGGKYRIERMLGEGGMGAVARAQHLLTRAPCALKFMNPQFMSVPGAVERFLKEGQAAARIRSDHVVQIYDVDKLPDGAPYIAMECLDGRDLDALLGRENPEGLPVERAVHFAIQILRGLQAAHGVGIVHRDMKPANCFVITKDGEIDFVKILDFGISKVFQPGQASLTQTNSALGTPLYMSPEQASSPRDVDPRSDLYSVGVILYEMLTGKTPFTAESGELTELLFKIFTAEIRSTRSIHPEIPEALDAVVMHALAREPAKRIASALALADALAPFAGECTLPYLAKLRAYVPPDLVEDTWIQEPMAAFSSLPSRTSTSPVASTAIVVEPTAREDEANPLSDDGANRSGGAFAATLPFAARAASEPLKRAARVPWIVVAMLALVVAGLGTAVMLKDGKSRASGLPSDAPNGVPTATHSAVNEPASAFNAGAANTGAPGTASGGAPSPVGSTPRALTPVDAGATSAHQARVPAAIHTGVTSSAASGTPATMPSSALGTKITF